MSKYGFFKPQYGRRGDSKNLPAKYIEDHVEDKDLSSAVVSPPLKYVARINSFALAETNEELERQEESLFSGAREELQLLKEAIDKYQQKTNPDLSMPSRVDGTASTWKDVREAVNAAKAREDGHDNESWSARDSCDKIVNNISAFETWLNLLPSGDYGAIVSGVFTMVVTAVKRAQDVRTTIFKALADIPYCVGRANRYRDLYAESKPQDLIQMTAQLCSAVLVALRHTMIYFTEGTLKKAWKTMAQGQAYKQTLLSHLERVRDVIGKVDQEAAVSAQYRLRDLERHCQGIATELHDLREQQNGKEFRLDESTKLDLLTRIGEVMAGLLVNSFYSQLSSNPNIDTKIRGAVPPQMLEAQPSSSPMDSTRLKDSVSQTSLLSALRASEDVSQDDLQRCLSMGTSLSLTDQDRVKWMMQSRMLLEWLKLPKPRTLLVNGNGAPNEMFAFTTFLSAKLLESLGHIKPIISHHFFCSLHTTSRDDIKDDAASLVRSFIVQLLLRDVSWDLSFLLKEDLEKIEHDDLETICVIFRKLVQQLPSATFLFWMIDGINYYERSDRRRDFLKVIHELLEIIEGCKDVVIKLLLTCHSKSAYVKEALEQDDVLTVPPTVDGSRQGWSERKFQETLGRDIENFHGVSHRDL